MGLIPSHEGLNKVDSSQTNKALQTREATIASQVPLESGPALAAGSYWRAVTRAGG